MTLGGTATMKSTKKMIALIGNKMIALKDNKMIALKTKQQNPLQLMKQKLPNFSNLIIYTINIIKE